MKGGRAPIYRYIQHGPASFMPTPFYRIALWCRNGFKAAKYKFIKIIKANLPELDNYLYKLDKRSIRYADGIKFIDNSSVYQSERKGEL